MARRLSLVTLALALATLGTAQTGPDVVARLRAAHEAHPDDPQVAAELGLVLYREDNTSTEARRLLEAAAPRLVARRDVQLALLDGYLAVGDTGSASALLQRLQPELDADERFALDAVYCLIGRRSFEEAKTWSNRVARRVQQSVEDELSRPPTSEAASRALQLRVGEVVFIQGLLTARLGEKDQALELLGQADGFGFPPLDSPLMMAAADTLYELQEYGLAAQAYQEVVNHAPDDPEARLRLGASLYSSSRNGDAREALEKVLARHPGYPRANYYLGAVLADQKDPEKAREHLERELARDPRCVRCLAKLGYVAYLGGDDTACQSWLGKARALDPDDLETLLVSGMLDNRSGRYEEAIRDLSQVVARSPGSIRAQYQLALAYQRSGNAPKAREHRQIYDRLIQEQKARTLGVRGSQD